MTYIVMSIKMLSLYYKMDKNRGVSRLHGQ